MSIINPIGTGPFDAGKLGEIRHAKLSFSHGGDGLRFFYVGKILSTKGVAIDDYIRDIAKYSGILVGNPCEGDAADRSPLDLNSAGPCYFVIELDDQHNWQFDHDCDAISTKKDYSQNYAGLRHVLPSGASVKPGKGCKLVYFAAIDPPTQNKKGEHGFNFHIEFGHGQKRLSVIIDPDIRYPGGNQP